MKFFKTVKHPKSALKSGLMNYPDWQVAIGQSYFTNLEMLADVYTADNIVMPDELGNPNVVATKRKLAASVTKQVVAEGGANHKDLTEARSVFINRRFNAIPGQLPEQDAHKAKFRVVFGEVGKVVEVGSAQYGHNDNVRTVVSIPHFTNPANIDNVVSAGKATVGTYDEGLSRTLDMEEPILQAFGFEGEALYSHPMVAPDRAILAGEKKAKDFTATDSFHALAKAASNTEHRYHLHHKTLKNKKMDALEDNIQGHNDVVVVPAAHRRGGIELLQAELENRSDNPNPILKQDDVGVAYNYSVAGYDLKGIGEKVGSHDDQNMLVSGDFKLGKGKLNRKAFRQLQYELFNDLAAQIHEKTQQHVNQNVPASFQPVFHTAIGCAAYAGKFKQEVQEETAIAYVAHLEKAIEEGWIMEGQDVNFNVYGMGDKHVVALILAEMAKSPIIRDFFDLSDLDLDHPESFDNLVGFDKFKAQRQGIDETQVNAIAENASMVKDPNAVRWLLANVIDFTHPEKVGNIPRVLRARGKKELADELIALANYSEDHEATNIDKLAIKVTALMQDPNLDSKTKRMLETEIGEARDMLAQKLELIRPVPNLTQLKDVAIEALDHYINVEKPKDQALDRAGTPKMVDPSAKGYYRAKYLKALLTSTELTQAQADKLKLDLPTTQLKHNTTMMLALLNLLSQESSDTNAYLVLHLMNALAAAVGVPQDRPQGADRTTVETFRDTLVEALDVGNNDAFYATQKVVLASLKADLRIQIEANLGGAKATDKAMAKMTKLLEGMSHKSTNDFTIFEMNLDVVVPKAKPESGLISDAWVDYIHTNLQAGDTTSKATIRTLMDGIIDTQADGWAGPVVVALRQHAATVADNDQDKASAINDLANALFEDARYDYDGEIIPNIPNIKGWLQRLDGELIGVVNQALGSKAGAFHAAYVTPEAYKEVKSAATGLIDREVENNPAPKPYGVDNNGEANEAGQGSRSHLGRSSQNPSE